MTDIEGSTRIWTSSPRAAQAALHRHDLIVDDVVQRNRGQIVESGREGDSVLAVFQQARDAVSCALAIQRALQREELPDGVSMRVRIAVHTGEADLNGEHYVRVALYRCARMLATAHGSQTIVSAATQEIVVDVLPADVSLLDLGLHRLRDFERAEHVYQLQHADLTPEFPPLMSLEPVVTDLPKPLTSFVGRTSDVAALRKLLSDTRLITLLGPGGIGKSRLAIEVSRNLSGRWPDGVAWVDLTPIEDPQLVPVSVAAALRLRGNGPALEVVNSWLAHRRVLLVLDNCEHVIDGCAEFCRSALARASELAILATSREAIGVAGEKRWPMQPLTGLDAKGLFEQRSQSILPSFKLTEANEGAVKQICRSLDNLPLAIEMAASRIGTMSEGEISRQLSRRLNLLAQQRSGEPRHQTMTATIDWSYRLLRDSEAVLLRRLSVFRGGFTLDSATQICADERIPDVTEALAGVVEKSMAVLDRLDGGNVRYRLLEVQAAYAEEKLSQTDELEAIRKRHYDYFLALTQAHWDDPDRSEKSETRRIRSESGNIWAALKWARNHEPDLGLSLAAAVPFVFYADVRQGHVWLRDLLDHSPAQGRPRMFATSFAAGIAFRQGDVNGHLRHALEAKEMSRRWGHPKDLVYALHDLGIAQSDLGRTDEAEATYHEALELLEESKSRVVSSPSSRRRFEEVGVMGDGGDVRWMSELIRNDLACAAIVQGRFEAARDMLSECVDALRAGRAVPSFQLGATLESLASAEFGCGELERAEGLWREVLDIGVRSDDFPMIISSIGSLARAASARSDDSRAVRLAGAHNGLSEEFSSRDQPWWLHQVARALNVSRERLGPKRSDEAWKQGVAMNLDRAVAYALEQPLEPSHRTDPLTKREIEVALLVARGMTNREIAGRLFLAERTVEGHVERIRNKLGFRSRTAIVAWLTERGVLSVN